MRRNADAHHAARDRQRFIHRDAVAQLRQIVRGSEAGRPRADDGDPFGSCARRRLHFLAPVGERVIDHEAFERHDADGFVDHGARAVAFAGMMARAATHTRKRIVFFDDAERFAITSLRDQRDVTLRALPGGTGITTRGNAAFLDRISRRHSLRVQSIRGLAIFQLLFILIGQRHRTHLRAVAAADALGHVDVTRPASHRHREVASLSIHAKHIGVGENLDVEMAAHVHQLGADVAHRAVIGRERLIELRHVAADRRFLLDEVDLEALIGQIERGLHPRDAAADDHHGADGLLIG